MKILNFGSCNIDYVYSLDHIVAEGETETASNFEIFPGGKGLNQSIAIARAGAQVYHAGCIGTDGEMLVDILTGSGVDVSYISRIDEKNGHAIIQVDKNGKNSIFVYPGSNDAVSVEYIDKVLENFEKGDILLLQNEISNVDYIVNKAYQKEMCIVFNPSPCNEKIFCIDFNKLSYIILNEVEAKAVSGGNSPEECIDIIKEKYPNLKIMLTLGGDGCIYSDDNVEIHQDIYKVEVVDTTAAGDTFTGYFVRGISQKIPYDEILRVSTAASAIAVSKNGAAPSIPKMDEVLKFIEK